MFVCLQGRYAGVLGRRKKSVYPSVNGMLDETARILNRKFDALESKGSRADAVIMWSSTASTDPQTASSHYYLAVSHNQHIVECHQTSFRECVPCMEYLST